MIAEVKEDFVDKDSGLQRIRGQKIEVTEERFKVLFDKGKLYNQSQSPSTSIELPAQPEDAVFVTSKKIKDHFEAKKKIVEKPLQKKGRKPNKK